MSVQVIGTLKPKNGLDFPVVEAIDVSVEGYSSLADAVSHFATDTAIAAINATLSTKANISDVNTSIQNLQGQINQIVISAAAETVVAPEVAAARVSLNGTEYSTLKERLDASESVIYNVLDNTNLADFNDENYSRAGVTITTTADGTIALSGTATIDGGRLNQIGNLMQLNAGTYYLISNCTDLVIQNNATQAAIGFATAAGFEFTLNAITTVFFGVNLTNGRTYDGTPKSVMLCADTKKGYVPAKKAVDAYARTAIESLEESDEQFESKFDNDLGLKIDVIPSTYINYQTGAQTSLSPYFSTDYIPILSEIIVRTKTNDDLSGIAFYNDNKDYISGYSSYSDNEEEVSITIPDAAKYVRITCLTAYKDNFICKFNDIIPNINQKVQGISTDVAQIKGNEYYDISNDITYTDGYYIHHSGSIEPLSPYSYSNNIELRKGEKINVTATVLSAGNVAFLSKWTANNTFIQTLVVSTDDRPQNAEYTATDDVEYIRICYHKTATTGGIPLVYKTNQSFDMLREQVTHNTIAINELADGNNNFWSQAMWKVLCIGDSLTSGANYNEEWGEETSPGASIDENYPRMLARLINGETTNAGFSGYSASTWWNNKNSSYTYNNYDTFIIWLGTNNGLTDTLDTDVDPYDDYNDFAETETGYYCKIIEKIKEENESCLIVLTKVFASKGNVTETNTTIDHIAEKYGLPVIDNSDLGTSRHPELHGGINNPHFGKAGNAYIANRYVARLGNWFAENPLRCEYHYTPRTN